MLVPVANRRDPRFGRAAPTRAAARPFKRGGCLFAHRGKRGRGKRGAWGSVVMMLGDLPFPDAPRGLGPPPDAGNLRFIATALPGQIEEGP